MTAFYVFVIRLICRLALALYQNFSGLSSFLQLKSRKLSAALFSKLLLGAFFSLIVEVGRKVEDIRAESQHGDIDQGVDIPAKDP